MKAADHRTVRAHVDARCGVRKDEQGAVLEHWREMGVNGGRPCCARATRIAPEHPCWRFCVCAYLEHCTVHGLTHVGTHD